MPARKPAAQKAVPRKVTPPAKKAPPATKATPAKKTTAAKAPAAKKTVAKKTTVAKKAMATKVTPAKKTPPAKKTTAVTAPPAGKSVPAAKASRPAPASRAKKVAPKRTTPGEVAGPATQAASAAEPEIRLAVREDETPWTPSELAEVRTELEAELARLSDELVTIQGGITDVLRDSGDGAGDDQADTGSKTFEREQGMTLLSTTRQALFQTEHALARIGDGSYGICESCGLSVGKLRLQAFPRATMCMSCKQAQERR